MTSKVFFIDEYFKRWGNDLDSPRGMVLSFRTQFTT
jgi:hypothetical protein